jgi:hypothetical protein
MTRVRGVHRETGGLGDALGGPDGGSAEFHDNQHRAFTLLGSMFSVRVQVRFEVQSSVFGVRCSVFGHAQSFALPQP